MSEARNGGGGAHIGLDGDFGRQDDQKSYKEFWLSTLAIRNPISVLVLIVLIVVIGLGSYTSIPKESSPEITIPNIVVSTIYPGASPDDVESLITQELEKELATIADIKVMTSASVEGYSSINVEFQAGTDMDEAMQQVREKVDLAKPELPSDAEDPAIFEIDISEFPILQVNISGEYSQVRLKELAEDMQDRIESIPSVLEVTLSGGIEREVQVNVDLPRLKYYELTFSDVVSAIALENVTIPGGSIDVGHLKYLIRTPGEFDNTRMIEEIVVIANDDRPVYVRDVATVDFAFKERASYARMDGNPVITLGVSKRAGENIIETAEAIKLVIEEMQPEFPATTRVSITGDQSEDIEDMVSSLENNIISGLLLVVAVLFFFLGVRNSLFVGIAIPLSMLLSFMVMKVMGISMNMVVLFSLILALGMLVDNAIVIVENIYRFMEQGFDRVTAARKATGEVAMPVIAATATTLAAFSPLLFWPGIVGEFMGFLPLTLIITLSSSLFVALVINPTLCSLFMRLEDTPRRGMTRTARWMVIGFTGFFLLIVAAGNPLTAMLFVLTGVLIFVVHYFAMRHIGRWFLERILPRLQANYRKNLLFALNHRWLTLAGTTVVFFASFFIFGAFNAGVEYFPEGVPPAQLFIQFEAPVGTRVDHTDEMVRRLESQVAGIPGREDFESVVSTVGSSQGGFGGSESENLATVAVSLVDFETRQFDTFATLETMRETIGTRLAGAEVSVEMMEMGPPTGAPIQIEIAGEDSEVLARLGDHVLDILENSPVAPALDGLESDLAEGRPELVVEVDRERAALFGLNTNMIGFEVRSAVNGIEASTYRDGEDEFDVVVRLDKEWRSNLEAIGDLNILKDGRVIPISSVARWYVSEGYGGINRKDQKRVVTITSDVRSGFQQNAVLGQVRGILAPFQDSLPAGYEISYAGQNQDQQEAQEFLSQAFVIAVFLIMFILISQFNSVMKPLIIISNVMLSIVGVLIGLVVFRMPFGIIMTGVGVISLAGIVVNNGIVLLDYIDVLRRRDGMDRRDALVLGGETRFRPVILTAVTTILGLIPLAIGLNIDFLGLYSTLAPNLYWGGEQAAWWGPMAIAVIAGLAFATFLTLILTPVMYSILDDLTDWSKRVILGR
ncbi:efflux RND transporter permease subunit [Gemmatimonadota bacterium]